MAHLGSIVQDLEKKLQAKITGDYTPGRVIDGCAFLSGKYVADAGSDASVLYLCSYPDLPDKGSGAPVLAVNCPPDASAPFRDCLLMNGETDLMTVSNVVQEVMLSAYRQKIRREDLFDALYSGNGLKGILNTAFAYLDNPVTLCDTSFSVISSAPESFDDSFNFNHVGDRFLLKDAKVINMVDQRVVDRIYDEKKPFVTHMDDLPFDWVFSGVRIRNAVIAYLCVRAVCHDIREHDLDYIDILSQMLSVEMQKDPAYGTPTGYKYEYFLRELLSGYARPEYIRYRLTQLGTEPAPVYHMLLIRFRSDSGNHLGMQYYCDQILSMFPESMILVSEEGLTVLLPTEDDLPFPEAKEKTLQTFLKLNNMIATVSYAYRDIAESRYYYRQLSGLLSMEQVKRSAQPVIYYEDYFAEHAFSLFSDRNLLKAAVHPHIQMLRAYESQHYSDYETTLRTYLAHSRNAASAASSLNIHKSTLFYRLSKMEQLFHMNLNDSRLLFAYEYSLRILRYLENPDHKGKG